MALLRSLKFAFTFTPCPDSDFIALRNIEQICGLEGNIDWYRVSQNVQQLLQIVKILWLYSQKKLWPLVGVVVLRYSVCNRVKQLSQVVKVLWIHNKGAMVCSQCAHAVLFNSTLVVFTVLTLQLIAGDLYSFLQVCVSFLFQTVMMNCC